MDLDQDLDLVELEKELLTVDLSVEDLDNKKVYAIMKSRF